jgi:hypothetical protein
MRHCVGELVSEGRGRIGSIAAGVYPDRAGRVVVVPKRIGTGEGIAFARGYGQIKGGGLGEHGLQCTQARAGSPRLRSG